MNSERLKTPPKYSSSRINVDIKPVGDGQAVLKYLAPYVQRVAISDNRIESVDSTSVTFRFTPTGKRHMESTLSRRSHHFMPVAS